MPPLNKGLQPVLSLSCNGVSNGTRPEGPGLSFQSQILPCRPHAGLG